MNCGKLIVQEDYLYTMGGYNTEGSGYKIQFKHNGTGAIECLGDWEEFTADKSDEMGSIMKMLPVGDEAKELMINFGSIIIE